ncbi:MAG: hypothetical protein IT372_32175, partial [Polyangiaceae bacterium]|nr:hypothetical protein [Polyangiaceae bacterium]
MQGGRAANVTGRPLVIVPTERHVEAELARRERERDASGEEPAGEVRSRWGFIAGALAALEPELAVASRHATRLAARMALDELPPGRLRQPAEPAARVALAQAFDRTLGILRRAGTSSSELRGLGAFAAAVADVLERSDAILRRARRIDPRGAGFALARALRDPGRRARDAERGQEPRMPSCGGAAIGDAPLPVEVTVRGIVAWEQEDLAWVEALHAAIRARGGRGVTVELPALHGAAGARRGPEGDALEPIADALERRWASLLDPPEIAWAEAPGSPAPAAAIAARTPEGEARAVAAEVVAALARGVPPERIAIVVPSLEDAALEPLRAALGDAGVRASEPRGRAVASCPDGRAALALLRLSLGPVSREQAIEILRAPGVHSGAWTERSSAREAARRATSLAHRLREVPVEIDRTGRLLVEGLTVAVAARRADAPAGARRRQEAPDDEAWMPRALEKVLASGRWLGDGGTRPE